MRCAACSSEVPDASRFCASCGAPVSSVSASPTRTHLGPAAIAGGGSATPSSDPNQGRFLPGMVIGARYRIGGLLGRGGMGEIYRADDLKLGQPVALKFLPEILAGNPGGLQRLRDEVRTARQVSHPNVCRVYDLSESDGHHFVTMEYVDGEDLASLLRRIGRLPHDKALEIARQICAGLAAAHDRGVLHRDLKPANVMIDGRGHVRITDFGLAGIAGEIREADIRAGTPAYMAPEQLAGTGVTFKSDLYALGLVLYEIFTGRKAWADGTPADIERTRKQKTPARPSTLTADFDPAVERAILRCLQDDPTMRPVSALAVAAALPGGDPLAAALAAGETPSPEMVAAAGENGGLGAAAAWSMVAAGLTGLLLGLLGAPGVFLVRPEILPKSREVLVDRARDVTRRLGYVDSPADSDAGFGIHFTYLQHILDTDPSRTRWDRLERGRPAPIFLWYRQSPLEMVPGPDGEVDMGDNPAQTIPGMVSIYLDPQGRLWLFQAVPPALEEDGMPSDRAPAGGTDPVSAPPIEPDWAPLFAEAGLDPAAFTPVQPRWTPPMYADRRMAWEGRYPESPEIPMRIEAAAHRGLPVYFWITGPWSRPLRTNLLFDLVEFKVMIALLSALLAFSVGGAILVARRNLRLGRGDRGGAMRVALFVFGARLIVWVFEAHHVTSLADELGLVLLSGLGFALTLGALSWVCYVALEPYVRRRWPATLIAWSRLLAGRFRDPLVGRDILIGAVVGIAQSLTALLPAVAPRWLGLPPPIPFLSFGQLETVNGVRHALSQLLGALQNAVLIAMAFLFLLVLLRLVLRRTWAAVGLFFLVLTALASLNRWQGSPWIDIPAGALSALLLTFLVVRVGLVAVASAQFVSTVLLFYPLTSNLDSWLAPLSLLALATIAAVLLYGAHTARAGRPLFGETALQE